MNDFTPEELRQLVARLDPNVMSPPRAAEELARIHLENPALADAARRFRADLARLYGEMVSLTPHAQHERLMRVREENADLAARLAEDLHITIHQVARLDTGQVPPEAFQASVPPRYTIERELGRGGMAVVYLARDSVLNRRVALKVIRDAPIVGTPERARAEAEAVARLQHPNIVQIFDRGDYLGHAYFSLEYCPGGNLADHLGGHPIPARSAAELVQTLALAIQTAHDARIIHRDLKPANVLLLSLVGPSSSSVSGTATTVLLRQNRVTPKVADFGLARFLDRDALSREGMIAGTPSYMAPEQARGDRDLGPAVDIYGLGAILYHCLTGHAPFATGSVQGTLDLVCNAEPVPPRRNDPNIPTDIEAVCLKCLEKSPRRRYESAEALADDLGRFLDGLPTIARPLGYVGRAWKLFRRRPLISSLTAALILAVLVGSGKTVQAARADSKRQEIELSAAKELAALAEKAVQVEKQQRHDDQVTTARILAQRGNWKDALPMYDEAIACDRPDRADLEVERMPGWLLMRDTPSIQAEFTRLLALTPKAPAERTALIRLHYGDFLHSDMARLDEASKFVGDALASGKLSPANAEYAKGLLCPKTTEALACFRKAVALASVHPRAHHALMLTHLIRGELDKTRERARFIENLFPDDTVSHLARSLADLMDGEYARSMADLDPLDRHCSPARMKAIRAFMTQFHTVHRSFNLEGKNDAQMLANVPAFVRMIQLAQKQDNSTTPFAFNIPVSRWLSASLDDMVEAAKASVLLLVPLEISINQAVQLLEPICTDHAEPVLHQMLGTAYLKLAHIHNKAKRPKECVEAMERASACYRRGAFGPTLAPRTSIRYTNLFLALQTDCITLLGHAQKEYPLSEGRVRELQQRVQSLLPDLLIQGRLFPEARAEFFASQQIMQHIPQSIAFLLIEDKQRDFPDDIRPLKLRIRLAIAQKDWGLSTSLLNELAQKAPKDGDLPKWKSEVSKKLIEGLTKK